RGASGRLAGRRRVRLRHRHDPVRGRRDDAVSRIPRRGLGMSKPLEDYGLIGNMLSAALVARDGSIDWLCLPHFDSPACFAALLGDERHGRWLIAPRGKGVTVSRRYVPDTAVLETRYETATGAVTLCDFMPLSDDDER